MKNKKKKKKLIIGFAIVITAAAAAGAGVYMWDQQKNRDNTEIVLEDGQTLVLGQVSSIVGNELTLSLAEEFDMDEQQNFRQGRNSGGAPDNMSGGAMGMPGNMSGGAMGMPNDMPGGSVDGQNSSSGNSADRQRKGSGSSSSSQQGAVGGQNMTPPSGMQQFDQKADNSEAKNSKDENTKNKNSEEQVVYHLTGETETYQIPVGTKVVTQLGKETTFPRIQTEDMLKVVLEENENGEKFIVAIWIVG